MSARIWHNMDKQPKQRFVLLDRDGVINRRPSSGYVGSWEMFEFLPRAVEALRLLSESGYTAIVISNQPCVGQGLLSSMELDAMTRRFLLETALSGGNIGQVYYCRHRAEDHCRCRKPQPGMALRAQAEHGFAAEETYFVGDSPEDLAAAGAAGCPRIQIRRDAFLAKPLRGEESPLVASNLHEAAEMILQIQKYEVPEMALVRTCL